MRVVSHHPWRQALNIVAVILVCAGGALAGYQLGRATSELDDTYLGSVERLNETNQLTIEQLEAQLVEADLTREVDREATRALKEDIRVLRDQVAALTEEVTFYKSLMAPGEIAQGLSLRPPELVALEEPGQFAFRIVAQQEARKHSLLKGDLSAVLNGELADQEVSYSLAELSDDLEPGKVPLRFRYFQSIEGELRLPEGFVPRSVDLVATATAPRKMEVREQFPWQLQEKFTHVGK